MPSLGVNPFEFLDEFFIPKTRVLELSVGEDFVILACVVFTQCQRVTDRQTDGFPTIASTGLTATLTPCKNKTAAQIIAKKCHNFPFVAAAIRVWPCGCFGFMYVITWPFWTFGEAMLVCGCFGLDPLLSTEATLSRCKIYAHSCPT